MQLGLEPRSRWVNHGRGHALTGAEQRLSGIEGDILARRLHGNHASRQVERKSAAKADRAFDRVNDHLITRTEVTDERL
jgi:hypothetical protein